MSKHTPAPWRAEPARSKYGEISSYWMIYGANGVQIADLFGLTGEQDEDGDDCYIPADEARANAELIASAPALHARMVELKADNVALQDAWQGDIEFALATSRERDELRARVAALEEVCDSARALLRILDASGNYPHQSFTIGAVLLALDNTLKEASK